MTLPARYYTDPEVFRRELATFFFATWICAGRAEQIPDPGDFFLRDLAGESIIITRDTSGDIQAFYNVCRHRGTRLCRPDHGEDHGKFPGRIQCPYHGWTYALDGKLQGAPHMDEHFRREDYPLHGIHTALWDEHIFLNLARDAQPLATQLADLPQKFAPWAMEDLRVHQHRTYTVQANWKLIVLNYNECLHCPILHPALNRITDYLSGNNESPAAGYIGGSMEFRGAAETMSTDGRRRRDFLPGLNETQRKQVLYYTVYPNFFLSLHPDYVMVHTLWPQDVDRTQIVCQWLFHPAELSKPEFQADDVIDFWDATNREDWSISELSQKGIRSRAYVPGPYSPQERLPHTFDQMILSRERSDP
jgi:Rieske 2Fe-2S family protein